VTGNGSLFHERILRRNISNRAEPQKPKGQEQKRQRQREAAAWKNQVEHDELLFRCSSRGTVTVVAAFGSLVRLMRILINSGIALLNQPIIKLPTQFAKD